ncbi:hypothetical protein CFP56_037696 [Quercus suber]|uniref:Uncharacterized protein n=1 Tax=Quercus suber TaxID=58331 RepID=A0AAW0LNV5_QUESU
MHINPYIFGDFAHKALAKRLFRVFAKKNDFWTRFIILLHCCHDGVICLCFFPSDGTKQSIDSSNISSRYYSFSFSLGWISAQLFQGKINMVFSNFHSESWR